MAPATKTPPQAQANGAAPADPMVVALAYEQAIADEATAIRDDAAELTPELFMKLWPLLKRPIPAGFIQTVGKVEGKPYASTGVRSVQVQIDRMNNVLTPLWWWDETEYEQEGKLATVTVFVGEASKGLILVERSSRGGVQRGTGIGNLYKGSYTNAAKRAFAAIGPGHEVYLGATDLDPDVDEDAAKANAAQEQSKVKADESAIGADIAKKMVERIWALSDEVKEKLRLAVSHAAGGDVGEVNTKPRATKAIAALTFPQAEQLDRWITKKSQGASDGGE
jgi:hypothetical protein